MKKFSIVLVLFSMLLVGCQKTPQSPNDNPTSETTSVITDDNMKQVGDVEHGYIMVPKTWVNFIDMQGDTGDIQVTDAAGTIITLGMPLSGIDKTEVDDITARLQLILEQNGATSIEVRDGEVYGNAAKVVRSHYSNGLVMDSYIFVVTYTLHIVSIEGNNEEAIQQATPYVVDTFRIGLI